MKISITNRSPVDIVVDINGKNKPEDKVILHPKVNTVLVIADTEYSRIKSIAGVIVNSKN